MAGDPTFTRAKRFKHFHADHTNQFDGSETIHTKTNLTASVDGNYNIKATELNLNRTKLVAPKNVLRTEKVTITPTNLTAAANTQTIPCFRASPGDTVYDVNGNVQTSFKVAAAIDANLVFEMGDKADVNGFGVSHAASPVGWIWDGEDGSEKGVYLRSVGASPIRKYKTYTTATLVNVKLSGADTFLASMDAGSVDLYVDIMSRG